MRPYRQERKTMIKWYYIALQDGRADDSVYPTYEHAKDVLDAWPEFARKSACIMSEWREERITNDCF